MRGMFNSSRMGHRPRFSVLITQLLHHLYQLATKTPSSHDGVCQIQHSPKAASSMCKPACLAYSFIAVVFLVNRHVAPFFPEFFAQPNPPTPVHELLHKFLTAVRPVFSQVVVVCL